MSDHGTAAPHGDTHDAGGHDTDNLGPIDWRMWGVGVVGVIAALVVVAGFVAAAGFTFTA